MRSQLARDLGDRWLRNVMLNKWLDYCVERGHRFPSIAALTRPRSRPYCRCRMGISDRLSNIRQLLPGARRPEEDERLLQLYWNRAELKKELSRLQNERHQLLEQIRNHEGAARALAEQLEVLEKYLGNPEAAAHALVYFQLRALVARSVGEARPLRAATAAATGRSRAAPSADRVRSGSPAAARGLRSTHRRRAIAAPTCSKRS